MNKKTVLHGIAALMLSTVLAACGKDEAPEPSAIEEAGKELGQAVSRDLKEEIDQAKAVEQQLQQSAENLDKQIEEQTSDAPTTEP